MPDFSDYVRTLAGAEAKTGSASWPAAAALWARVVELNPVVGRHWVRLAEARFELGDYGGALAAYGTAQGVGVWLHRDEIEAVFPAEIVYRMATCHVRRGDHEGAVRELRRALRLGLRDLGRPKRDEHWEPLLGDEAIPFTLPYSKASVNVADLYWQTSWPMDHRPWIAPELYAPPSFEAYSQNRDPAMEAILSCREHLPGW